MSWTPEEASEEMLTIEEQDVEWFENHPDRILRRRTASPFEGATVRKRKPEIGTERVWVLVLRTQPVTRLYYIDPEDFWDYGEPAVNDDYTLMVMWEVINQNLIAANQKPSQVSLLDLQRIKAALIAYCKHQRRTMN